MLKSVLSSVDQITSVLHPTIHDVADGTLNVVAQLLHTRIAAIARIESTTYTIMAVVDQLHALRPGQMYNLRDTFCVHMLESGQPLCINNTAHAPQPFRSISNTLELGIRAYAGVPLYMADGRVFGSLWIGDSEPRNFTDQDVALMQLIARLLTHELDQDAHARHTERIEQTAALRTNVDPTTGLFARDSFEGLLRREAARRNRYGNIHAVAVLTIEPSMAARERYGAQIDDTLRQGLADILMRTSRLVDCCARLDDNEFGVLFVETSTSGVAAWRKRIESALEAWNRVHMANDLTLSIRIGVADCHDVPQGSDMSTTMLDIARCRANEEGIGQN